MTKTQRRIIHPEYITTTHSDIKSDIQAKHLELYTMDWNDEEITLEVWTEDNRICDVTEDNYICKFMVDYYLN